MHMSRRIHWSWWNRVWRYWRMPRFNPWLYDYSTMCQHNRQLYMQHRSVVIFNGVYNFLENLFCFLLETDTKKNWRLNYIEKCSLTTKYISEESSVLIFHTSYSQRIFAAILLPDKVPYKPIMTDLNGKETYCSAFTVADDVEVFYSCAVTYQNQFFVYGGFAQKRQIAQVKDMSLINVGSLPFDFIKGGCSSTKSKITLCFNYDSDYRTCYQTTNPTEQFVETTKSNHNHRDTRFASSECKSVIPYNLKGIRPLQLTLRVTYMVQTLYLFFRWNASLWQLWSLQQQMRSVWHKSKPVEQYCRISIWLGIRLTFLG